MIHTQTLKQLRDALDSKQISSVELTQVFLARMEQHNDNINAFITVTPELALQQARAADDAIAAGNAGALTGIPMAQKDIFCTDGVKTTCGSKMLNNFIAPYNATVVEKLNISAGMPMLGKLNMDEFAMGSSNETSFYGNVQNPWATNCIPGGSSGGSAAALAARLAPAVTGTDTGGSIRQPAAMCGVTGLKPTYGAVSRFGMIAFASSLDQAGPMAHAAEDCAMMLNAMVGFDEKDSTSINHAYDDYTVALNRSLDGLTIGLPKEFFANGMSAPVADAVGVAIKQYEALGARIKEISLPNANLSVPAYYVIAPAEASSNLSRFDGVRYGHRCDHPENLTDLYKRSRAEGFGTEVKRRIMIGTYALSAGYYDAYYRQAQRIRRLIAEDFKQAFAEVDVILGPTTPNTAFEIGSKKDDPVEMYLSDIYTIVVNLAGLPGMSLPCGFDGNKPIGMQLIGNYFDEARLLNIAHQFQQHTDWHNRTPKNL